MKVLQVADDIVPIGIFKTQAARLLRQIHSSSRPLVITQNGRPAAVMLTPAEYDRLSATARFRAAVEDGLEDVRAGRTTSDEDFGRELDAEFVGHR